MRDPLPAKSHRLLLGRLRSRYLTFAFLAAISVLQLGSQSPSGTVVISSFPAWGQDGQLTGYVYGLPASQVALYIFAFIPDVGWVSIPGCGQTAIQSTGQFSVNATPGLIYRNATRFTAILVPSSLTTVPCLTGSPTIPFIALNNALSSASYPRLANYQTLSFGGLDWFVKTAPIQVSPYNQFFVNDNAFVDAFGQLHLKVTQCSGSWCAAEIFTKQTIGYGTYSFTIASQVNNLDPNLTLGLFTWDAQAADQYNREWDIEFSRWGNSNATSNAQYVVQPYNGPNNLVKFLMSPSTPSIHTVTWSPNQVSFVSSSPAGPISSWVYSAAAPLVPTPGDVHLHLNLYIGAGTAPVSPVGTEIVISNFQYTPSSAQIGLGRVADGVPFYSTSATVPIIGTAGCSATVESDSPWISIAGSASVAAGGNIGYTVSDNYGGARTGNIILTSTTCSPTLGSQVIAITQAGLVCTPTFGSQSTSIGFIQSVRSVIIQASAPVCTWSVSSSVPWLQITSSPAGTGDGSITFSADANSNPGLRSGLLVLNNGQTHSVFQDASGSLFALSPSVASACSGQQAQFGASWIANSNVEIHLNSPTGTLVGQFGASGATLLPLIGDGTLVYLVQAGTVAVLASASASVTTNCTAPAVGSLGIVNAASYSAVSISAGSFVTLFGANLSASTAQATSLPYPTNLGGASVSIGGELCGIAYASPGQINFIVPSDISPGRYLLSAGSATSEVIVSAVSPGIFTLKGDGTGVPLAQVIGTLSDGTSISLSPYTCNQTCGITPMILPGNLTDLYIVLYGTGFRNLTTVSAVVGSTGADVVFAGAVSQYPGLDQMNLHLKSVSGLTGIQTVQVQANGTYSNTVTLQFQ